MLNQIAGKTLCHCQIDASGTVFKLLANVGSPEKTKHGKTASQSMGDAAQARTIMLNTRLLQFIHKLQARGQELWHVCQQMGLHLDWWLCLPGRTWRAG